MIRRAWLWMLFVVTANACAEPSRPPRPEVTRTDSAGIEIVVSAGPAWTADEVWRLADKPSLDLPSVDANGTRHFYSVSGAHRFADGRLVVSDLRAKRLRFYGPDGAFLNSGAQPAGPGVFATIGGFVVGPGDSLAVYDWHSNATILGPNGEYGRRVPLPDQFVLRSRLRSWRQGGEFCAAGTESGGGRRSDGTDEFPPSVSWSHTIPFCFQEESPVTATDPMPSAFGSYRGPDMHYFPFDDGKSFGGLFTLFATRPTVRVRGDEMLIAPGAEAEVQVRRIGGQQAGTLERIYRFRKPRTPATPELLEQLVEKAERGFLANSPNSEWRDGYLAALRESELPDSVSAIEDMLVDQPGNLWLAHPWPKEGEWSVLDHEGVWLGKVVIPDGMKPLEIGDDWMLVRTQEVDEVHSVRLYGLVKPN